MLDVRPYTSEGMSKDDEKSSTGSEKDLEKEGHEYFYELVGIIVHSGQANAGHYYSYIKNRRCGFCMDGKHHHDIRMLSLSWYRLKPRKEEPRNIRTYRKPP